MSEGSDSGRLQSDLERLAKTDSRPPKTLPGRPDAAPIPASIGSARPKPASASQQSSGIASPLTETVASREYHPTQTLTSTNGLFVFTVKPVKKLNFTDAMGRPVAMNLEP